MKTKAFPEANLPPQVQEKADRMNLDEASVPPYSILPLKNAPQSTGPLNNFQKNCMERSRPAAKKWNLLKAHPVQRSTVWLTAKKST